MLITEHHHPSIRQDATDIADSRVIQRLCQVETTDFGPDSGAERTNRQLISVHAVSFPANRIDDAEYGPAGAASQTPNGGRYCPGNPPAGVPAGNATRSPLTAIRGRGGGHPGTPGASARI